MVKPSHAVVLVFLLFGVAVGFANADSVYDFVIPSETPFSLTSNGLTATFDCNNGPRSCSAIDLTGIISLPGTVLATSTATSMSILFSSNATSISLDFSTFGAGLFELSTLENGAPVGFVTAPGKPGGTISFTGGPFNGVIMDSTSIAPGLAIDNVDVKPVATATPEPATLLLLVSGLGGVAALWRRKIVA
jgi:hypothetical protein